MLLYKAVERHNRTPYMSGGYIFMSPSVEGAFMWAETLFGSKPYFINEYKVPNSELGLYNNGTYRIDNGKWTGGVGSTEPMEIGNMPDIPDTGQIAILSDSMDWEYRQIAYFDGENLITKDKNSSARITVGHQAGQLAAYIDRLDVITSMVLQSVKTKDGTLRIVPLIELLSDSFNLILQSISSISTTDGLTVEFTNYIKTLESQLKIVQKNELDVMLKLSSRLTDDDTQENDDILDDMTNTCEIIRKSTADIIEAITTVDFLEPRSKSFIRSLFAAWY